MADHIGYELRCAESKFTSLDTGQYLRFKHLAGTEFVPPGNYFLHVEGLLVARYRSEAPPAVFPMSLPSEFESCQPGPAGLGNFGQFVMSGAII